jgi:hypothetical protein
MFFFYKKKFKKGDVFARLSAEGVTNEICDAKMSENEASVFAIDLYIWTHL